MAYYDNYKKLEGFIDKNTKAIFCESIGNPAGNVVDIQRLAEVGRRHGVPVVVGNTVATPYLCRPFELGAAIVVHSLAAYIGGHGSPIAGVDVGSGTSGC